MGINERVQLAKKNTLTINCFNIFGQSNVNKLCVTHNINSFGIGDSSIGKLCAIRDIFIKKLNVADSVIDECFRFTKRNFEKNTYDSWLWIE